MVRHVRPGVVLGMGSYITFPGGMVSMLLGRPPVLHEQNSIVGPTSRVPARVADRVLCTFPNALAGAEWVGNSIRADLVTLASPRTRYIERTGPLRMLVVGGSPGAVALNDVMPKVLALLPADTYPIVIHRAGTRQIDTLCTNYAAANIDDAHIQPVPFIDDMAAAYARVDLVICHAGVTTVSEVAVTGVAALFVPFSHVVDGHQTTSACFLSEYSATLLVPQQELSPASLADTLVFLMRTQLADIAAKAHE